MRRRRREERGKWEGTNEVMRLDFEEKRRDHGHGLLSRQVTLFVDIVARGSA